MGIKRVDADTTLLLRVNSGSTSLLRIDEDVTDLDLGTGTIVVSAGKILLESGDALLAETSDFILLE